jgi:hypothetical protein
MCVSIAGVASLALSGCGSGARQDAHEAKGKFRVSVPTATFPASQHISGHTHLVISVHNDGRKTIPNVAVTICNVTCSSSGPHGSGSGSEAFAADISGQYLANSSRPNWVVDQGPGKCAFSCKGGGAGAGVTAYSNTWALGSLKPGRTVMFKWAVTAVAPGTHVIAWQIAAGLNGNARAVMADGSEPGGKFTVTVQKAPAQSYVNNQGQIVTTQ